MHDFFTEYFTFDGESSKDFGMYVGNKGLHSAPAREYEEIQIEGRNGTLLIDKNRYSNVTLPFENALIMGKDKIELARSWLTSKIGYKRLEVSYLPDEFYLAKFDGNFNPVVSPDMELAKVDIEFSRKPQRFLKSGETPTTLTATGRIENPTRCTALPLLEVYGTGQVAVNDTYFKILKNDSSITIDSELEDCYSGLHGKNSDVEIAEFPKLESGSNSITLGSGITKVIITPRWWIL